MTVSSHSAEPAWERSAASKILTQAADLIEPEGRWTQGAAARNAAGVPVYISTDAACYCAMGAMALVAGAIDEDITDKVGWFEAVCAVQDIAHCVLLTDWNDASGRTQAEVVATLRAAAAHLQVAA